MNEQKEKLIPVDENQRSIDILNSLQNYAWFSRDPKDETQVRLYDRIDSFYIKPAQEHFTVTDFLKAVDFYQKNRDADVLVKDAMRRPDGFVNVWTGPKNDRKVAVRIKNYLVPQILEFAYQLVRNAQKANPQTQS